MGTPHASVRERDGGMGDPARPRGGAAALRGVAVDALVARSAPMRRVARSLQLAGGRDRPVLVTGEPGAGKRTVARAVHGASPRAGDDLTVYDCAAAAYPQAEADLFGEPGGDPGLIELSGDRTLLLVEIGELSLAAQSRLCAWAAAGGRAHLIATTSRDLADPGGRRPPRRELARLFSTAIDVPPLRERRDDLPLLIEQILARASAALGRSVTSVSPEVLDALREYPWPGNLRELEQVLESAVDASPPGADLIFEVPRQLVGAHHGRAPLPARSLGEVEHQLLLSALRQHRGNVPRVARTLGVSRGTVYNMMRKYRVDPSSYRAT